MAEPRGAELQRLVLDERLKDVHTAMPCEVRAFDATAHTVDVQPMIKNVTELLDGTKRIESYPLIRNVPVQWPRGGGFVVMFPMGVGDIVTALFNEWSIDYFRQQGKESEPIDLRRHNMAAAVAIPGGPTTTANAITETVDGLVVGHDGGAVLRIKTDGTMAMGSTASAKQAVALAADTKTELNRLKADIDALRTAFNAWLPTANDGGLALQTLLQTPITGWIATPVTIADVGSSKVTVEE